MLNFNGKLLDGQTEDSFTNRGFLYGDGVFETVRISGGRVLFLEDHYFRLMSSMRIVRMQIPMEFTMEFIESQLLQTAEAAANLNAARVRITVFRNGAGFYLPEINSVSFVVSAISLSQSAYTKRDTAYEVELYKDFYVTRQLLSSVKSTNRLINITGSVFAHENGYDNCLLMNDSKNVIESLNGNLFMLRANKLITPPVSEGCLNGVMRRQILAIARNDSALEVSQEIISPFDLQKADELFITNVIVGIQPITRYRKKEYPTEISSGLLEKLNAQVGSG